MLENVMKNFKEWYFKFTNGQTIKTDLFGETLTIDKEKHTISYNKSSLDFKQDKDKNYRLNILMLFNLVLRHKIIDKDGLYIIHDIKSMIFKEEEILIEFQLTNLEETVTIEIKNLWKSEYLYYSKNSEMVAIIRYSFLQIHKKLQEEIQKISM